MTTTTTAILASDFSASTLDTNRHEWNLGTMRHVIAALNGQPVAIICDKRTGFAEVGVRLTSCFDGGPSRGPRVTIERDDEDGVTRSTTYWLPSIGEAIIPVTHDTLRGAKWDALDSYRDESSAAIALVRDRHPEWSYGKWEARPFDADVQVTYEAQREGAGPRFAYDKVSLSEIVADVTGKQLRPSVTR